jgi:hypothetical protein
MTKRVLWTKEEDEILVQAVKANPHNKAQAFRNASEKLDRSVGAISFRWYECLSNPKSKCYVGCMFTMIGHASRLDNRTINRENVHVTPMPVKKGLWRKIKELLNL